MNTRKLLTSAVAATTIVGAIGLAYAQSNDPSTSPTPSAAPTMPSTSGEAAQPSGTLPPTDSTRSAPMTTPSTTDNSSAPSNSAAPASSDTAAPAAPMDSEPAPKADRN